uniref:DCC interacting protein 13 beta n=1 Tax=Echinococcus granulosus TaxID=6210 RepID=A0A068W727_ECHGR|nr:DCC interacting protein 13 beta [Echinococcus granulosus]
MELLRLKEAMSNAPHAQQLATQFAADAQDISHLLREFNTACSYIHQAQETLAQCYLQMSEISRLIGSKTLSVQSKNPDFENICLQFSSFLEELSGMHRAEAEELRSALFLPAHKLPSQPGLQLVDNSGAAAAGEGGGGVTSLFFADLRATQRHREACEREVHASLARYMRLTRRCAPKEHDDAVLELSRRRRMFQQAAVIYHARLNAAHFEREMVPLNAFFGFLTTLRIHCKKIAEVVEQPSLAQFAEVIKSQFDCRQVQSTQATEEFLNTLTNIQSQSLALFAPEPLFAKSDKSYLRTPETNLLSKSGYLYMRVKKTFGFDWNEVYCFTQGGNLLCQQKGDLGAGVLVNLNGKGVFAEPMDIDDRRYTFQIVSPAEKRVKKQQQHQEPSFIHSLFSSEPQHQPQTVVLQAENSTDRDEWIHTISNVIINTSSWAGQGQPPPEPRPVDPLPFVLVPRSQTSQEASQESADEEDEMERALRASLSCTAWIAQAPPLHLELTPVDAPAVPDTTAEAVGDANADLEVVLTFIGSMPLPRFLVNRLSVEEVASHILAKRATSEASTGQACVARFTPNAIFLVSSSSPPAVLGHFRPSQIVHCAEVNVDAVKPGSRYLLLLTLESESPQRSDPIAGDLHLCYFFETANPAEFAERVLNLQLTRLAALNEEGDSPEKDTIMENITSFSDWNSLSTVEQSPLQVSEAPQDQPLEIAQTESGHQSVPAADVASDQGKASQNQPTTESTTGPEE